MSDARITALTIYPIKSCAGISLDEAAITSTGLELDRRWMIVDALGRFQTQRELPRLALIVPRLAGDELHLSAPGMPELGVRRDFEGERLPVKIWNDECIGIDAGEQAAQWLSRFIGKPLRLVGFDPGARRPVEPGWADGFDATAMFSDAYSFLVLSEGSLAQLNARLAQPLPMNRFRPNIVLGGIAAHDEDRMRELQAGEVRIRLVKPCTRCVITTTDQTTGERCGDEPLRTLKSYRWDAALRGVAFGQNAILVQGVRQRLHVGQRMDIVWA